MIFMQTRLIVVIAVVAVLLIWYVGVYNSLVSLRNKVRNQFSQIDVQLKKRFALIPNLVETVKGYAKHEKETFEEIVNARNGYASAKTDEEKMQANTELTKGINKLLALAEAYPELKANENFLGLQKDLKDVEEKISYARQFYNDSVMTYNNKIEMFPSNIAASIGGFKKEAFFEANENERENVKVEF